MLHPDFLPELARQRHEHLLGEARQHRLLRRAVQRVQSMSSGVVALRARRGERHHHDSSVHSEAA